jgi:hypothetical protein
MAPPKTGQVTCYSTGQIICSLHARQVTSLALSYPFYHVFHPTEHGRIRVTEPASDGAPGMGAGRVTHMSANGMTVVPEVAGLNFGEIQHFFEPIPTGTQYKVISTIGVQWPLIGGAVNALIRYKMYPEAMLTLWERHQIEEVGMLQHYLKSLYTSKPVGDAYQL